MFGLLLPSNHFIDFSTDTTITLNLNCPIFDPDSLNREWSYPIRIARSPANERELRAGRLDTLLLGRRIPATLYIEGIPYETGVIKVTAATRENISIVFQSEALTAREVLESARLRDFSVPVQISEPADISLELLAEWGPLDGDAVLTIRIDGILYEMIVRNAANFIDVVNVAHPGLLSLLEQGSDYLALTMNPIEGVEQLEVELSPVLTEGPQVIRVFFAVISSNYRATYDRIMEAYSNYESETETSPFRLPSIYAPQLYDGKNESWSGVANRYQAGQYIQSPIEDPEKGWQETLLPQPRAAILLENIAAAAGLTLAGSFAEDDELRELLVWNTRDLSNFITAYGPRLFYQIDSELAPLDAPWVVYAPEWNLAQYTPDISALELIKAVNFTFAHFTQIENGTLRQTPIRLVLQGTPEDWSMKVDPEYQVSYAALPDYALDYNRQSDEREIAGQLERVAESSAAEVTEYICPAFSLFEQVRDEGSQRARFPVSEEVGSNTHFGTGQQPSLRFFFHRGLQPDANGGIYPQAGHSRQGFSDEPVGNYSLNWDGPGGLIDAWWRELLELLQHGRQDTREVRLTVADLLEIKRWRRVRKYYLTEDGTAVGVIRSVRVRASRAGLGLAQVTFQLEPA